MFYVLQIIHISIIMMSPTLPLQCGSCFDVMVIVHSTNQCIIIGPSAKRVTLQELVERYNLTDEQLNSEIEDSETPELALCFDDVDLYSSSMVLTIADQADVKRLYHSEGTRAAMMKCLQIWKDRNPFQATYRALLDIALRLGKGDTAHQICQQLIQRKYMYTCYYMSGDKPPPPKPSTK